MCYTRISQLVFRHELFAVFRLVRLVWISPQSNLVTNTTKMFMIMINILLNAQIARLSNNADSVVRKWFSLLSVEAV